VCGRTDGRTNGHEEANRLLFGTWTNAPPISCRALLRIKVIKTVIKLSFCAPHYSKLYIIYKSQCKIVYKDNSYETQNITYVRFHAFAEVWLRLFLSWDRTQCMFVFGNRCLDTACVSSSNVKQSKKDNHLTLAEGKINCAKMSVTKHEPASHISEEQRSHMLIRSSCRFLFQMKPTRCTLLLSIFISNSLHVSGEYVPIFRRSYCIYATRYFALCMGGCLVCSWQPPIQSAKYQCRIDTVISPDDGHIVARNMQKSWNKYTKKLCAPSWLHLKRTVQGCSVNKHKITGSSFDGSHTLTKCC